MLRWIVAVAASGLLLAGCGSDEDEGTAGSPAAAAAKATIATTYTPTSDVSANAAVGKDVAAIRALLAPEQAGAKPDFKAAGQIWSKGRTPSRTTARTARWRASSRSIRSQAT